MPAQLMLPEADETRPAPLPAPAETADQSTDPEGDECAEVIVHPRHRLRELLQQAHRLGQAAFVDEIRARLEQPALLTWDEIEGFQDRLLEAQTRLEESLPDYYSPQSDDTPEAIALRYALHRHQLSSLRWHQRRQRGLTDVDLKEALAEELGGYSGFDGHGIDVRFRGGNSPTIWIGPEGTEIVLEGAALVAATRELLEIPWPLERSEHSLRLKGGRSDPEPEEDEADPAAPEGTDPVAQRPEFRLEPAAPRLLADQSAALLEEVRSRWDFLDLRWWPHGFRNAPLASYAGPTRARAVLATLQHRGVAERDIRRALEENWTANSAAELARQYESLATGDLANRAADLLSAVSPAFTDPPDGASYWDRSAGYSARLALGTILADADDEWLGYCRLAEALETPLQPIPDWILTLGELLPVLEAFETDHPQPEDDVVSDSGAAAHYLVSWGAYGRWVRAASPEAAARTACQDGLTGTGSWLIIRRLQRGSVNPAAECPVVAILPSRAAHGIDASA